jgi:hypothetical protein
MPSLVPDGEPQRPAAMVYTPQDDVHEGDHTTVQRYMLGELFMTLGRHLQEEASGEVP